MKILGVLQKTVNLGHFYGTKFYPQNVMWHEKGISTNSLGPCFYQASSTGDAGQVGWLEIEKAGFGEDCS